MNSIFKKFQLLYFRYLTGWNPERSWASGQRSSLFWSWIFLSVSLFNSKSFLCFFTDKWKTQLEILERLFFLNILLFLLIYCDRGVCYDAPWWRVVLTLFAPSLCSWYVWAAAVSPPCGCSVGWESESPSAAPAGPCGHTHTHTWTNQSTTINHTNDQLRQVGQAGFYRYVQWSCSSSRYWWINTLIN